MTPRRILVVEDETIVAEDIVEMLRGLGYETVGPCATVDAALEAATSQRVDLALMDIHLGDGGDGVAAATALHDLGIGVIFLTAYADEATTRAASRAEPYGYVVKPFDEHDLRTAIGVALYKQEMDVRLRRAKALLHAVLGSVSEAIIAVDATGHITFINAAASRLLTIEPIDAQDRPVWTLIRLEEADSASLASAIDTAMRRGEHRRLPRGARLRLQTGTVTVDGQVAPLVGPHGEPEGMTLILHEKTQDDRVKRLEAEVAALREARARRIEELL